MREHITSVCCAFHFHLRNIGSIHRYLTPETCATLVHSLISSKLDYCNALLIKLPEIQINRLQRIQNSAARIVSRLPRHEHITPVLENLHWLPVQQRIMFKVVIFVFKCLNDLAPPYLAELITVKENSCSCQLRSDGCLQEKKTNNKFGDRAFSMCGPVLWNRLPKCMKEINCLDKFMKELKTHLLRMCLAKVRYVITDYYWVLLCFIHVFCWYMNTFLLVFPPYLQSAIEYCIDPGT